MEIRIRAKRSCWSVVVAAVMCGGTVAAQERGALHVGIQAGLLGLGVVAGYDIHDRVAVRTQANRLEYNYDGVEAGNDYTGDLALSSMALLVDWHPGGAFRFTAGALLNGNELSVGTSSRSLELGLSRYDGELEVRMTFDGLAPYAGIGWSAGRDRSGLGVVVDVGVLFQGVPKVTADGVVQAPGAGTCTIAVAADSSTTLTGSACGAWAGLREDATMEHEELADLLADFEMYPVAALGLVYRF